MSKIETGVEVDCRSLEARPCASTFDSLVLDGATLTFTKVKDDECPGRVAAMTPKPFTAVK